MTVNRPIDTCKSAEFNKNVLISQAKHVFGAQKNRLCVRDRDVSTEHRKNVLLET